MTFWALLSFVLRAIGFFGWADRAWDRHEERVAANAQNDVSGKSDDAVSKQLRDDWTRD